MHKGILTSLIIALAASVASCDKNKPPAPIPTAQSPVFVICEGSLGNGNSALTMYDVDSNSATEDIYSKVNGHSLGDVFQSMTLSTADFYFLCINNSDRIVVIGKGGLGDVGTISVPKPRYMLQVSDSKAYVSTLFSKKVYIINPRTLQINGTIDMPHKNPEGMALVGKSAYICTWDTATTAIYPIDTSANTVGTPVLVAGAAPHDILKDAEGMLWVLSGNKTQGAEAKLTRIDPASGAILKSYAFGTADPMKLTFNRTKDTLYFVEVSYSGGPVNNGIYRMGIHDA